jgi:hypothetical protein
MDRCLLLLLIGQTVLIPAVYRVCFFLQNNYNDRNKFFLEKVNIVFLYVWK